MDQQDFSSTIIYLEGEFAARVGRVDRAGDPSGLEYPEKRDRKLDAVGGEDPTRSPMAKPLATRENPNLSLKSSSCR